MDTRTDKVDQPSARPTRKVLVQAIAGILTAVIVGIGKSLVGAVPGLAFLEAPGVTEGLPIVTGFFAAWLVREYAPDGLFRPAVSHRKRELRSSAIAGLIALLLTGLPLGACEAVRGAWGLPDADGAEVPAGVEAYAELSRLVYFELGLAVYQEDPGAPQEVKELVCIADPYRDALAAVETVRLTDDDVAAALAALSGYTLRVSQLVAGGPVDVTLEDGQRVTVILARAVGALGQARAWRQAQATAIARMVAEDRAPTAEEWAALEARAERVHERVQAPCSSG